MFQCMIDNICYYRLYLTCDNNFLVLLGFINAFSEVAVLRQTNIPFFVAGSFLYVLLYYEY